MGELQMVASTTRQSANWFKKLFVRIGILPVLLVAALIIFTLLSDNFLTSRNLMNVLRQSVYLMIVSLGQMLALLTGGFDLSVGTILAVTSVVGALAMSSLYVAMPDAVWLAILLGCIAGVAAGTLIGVCNGIGVAIFNVSPFMMSLGMASVGFGAALYLTGGVPVYGMPQPLAIHLASARCLASLRRFTSPPLLFWCFICFSIERPMDVISMQLAAISRRPVCRASIRD